MSKPQLADLLIPFTTECRAREIAQMIAERCNITGVILCDGRHLPEAAQRQLDMRAPPSPQGDRQ